ncbi:mycocerosic acid synthase-like polyketide synthase isoform X2 [Cyclopterus lumpus]|uniref:mycocerosic acid synthase-like polyketide synthase isoform X2 n=1 Tax=Cyclopterus lumpus TaxID=8103 RepID=UPI0014868E73|nr:mycocerosic acid synthase-like polyketide synthase isoform X2 [Cyclopterus lumpus]
MDPPLECIDSQGLMNRDYEILRSNSPTTITHYNGTGTAMSVAANRLSFSFNLTGPSLAIDSACSSSLVALHLACQAIKQGDCEMALCGGVSCIIEPRVFVALSKAKMISPEGTSKPFSSRADGYGRGEGCGVVLLKPLKDAMKDCNKVWGIVSKTAVNQDGHSVTPITKPSMTQQQELLQRLYSESDVANVQYIEAHGTGTPVGDPTEAGSISNAIAKARPPGSEALRIGSVKGNIGHTESAAGVAGLIKVLLMMKHETIVPSVFYSEDNASVDVKALSISIPVKAERWETEGSLGKVAGINSFGFGGTNAHVIIREYRKTTHSERPPTQIPKSCPKLFVISAACEESLHLSIADTRQRLCRNQSVDLQALSYTSACGRSHSRHRYRKAFPTSSLSDLEQRLTSAVKTNVESIRSDIQVVFVFCGNGVAYRGMCKQLLRDVPIFRDKVRAVENLFQSHKSISISRWLAGEYDNDVLGKPDVVQPLLFAIQVGIAALLKHWGVKPDAVLGHSVGEVAAAHCSGLLSLEDAVKVVHHRSTLQSEVTGGKMLVVGNVAVENVLQILPEFSGNICVAAFNSPQSCTLSGNADAIDILHQRLKKSTERNLFLHELDVTAAYHSHMMDPILDDLEKSIEPLNANNKECKLFSTVTGYRCSDGDFVTGSYWARNIREPVLFERALRAATKDKRSMVFVEIGPRRALQRNIHESLGKDAIVLSSVQPEKDYKTMLSTVGKLFELGISVDWHQLHKGCETLPTALPVYQFVNTKKELNFEALRKGGDSSTFSPFTLLSQTKQDNKEYMCNLSLETAPYLWEHKNNGVSIVPGAFYVELAYAAVMASLRPKKPVSQLQLSVRFESLFALSSNCHQLKVKLEHAENGASFKIQSTVATHASGTYRCADGQPLLEEPIVCLDMISQRCTLVMKRKEIYSILSLAGFEYGSVFKQLNDVRFGDEFKEAVTAIQVPGQLLQHLHEFFIHPVLLDYFLQMTAVVAIGRLTAKQGFPSAIGSVTISGPLQEEMVMYLRATEETPDFLDVCGSFATPEGHVLVELKGVRISFLGNCSSALGSWFFNNEITAIPDIRDLQNCKIKAIVFEDKLGIAKGLKPYIHPESALVESREHWMADQIRNVVFGSLTTNVDIENVLFIWGVEDLSRSSSEKMLDCLVNCCELFRQIVLALKESKRSCTVRVITYRSTETMVDHVSPGFVLSGMTRACAAEMTGLSFQLIDLASVTSEDIETLVCVINTCKEQEVVISEGQALTTRIARTPMRGRTLCEGDKHYMSDFVLQTADPYRMTRLSAIPYDTNANPIQEKSVEVQLTNVCVQSSDFFPVTTSHLKFGKTMYWNKHTSHNHKLLALDFSGIVTAVGKDVHNLRVGDQIASCYPVVATAKVVIPETVCYSTKRLPFLKETPCVSYFVLAWEILQKMLFCVKHQHRKLIIISSNSASTLIKVLALTANRSGWNVSSLSHFRGESLHFDQSHAFVFLPPFDHSWQGMHDSCSHNRHIIFVSSDHISPSFSANMFAPKSEHIHVHKLDVANVLQRASLQMQKKDISDWLSSLGFDTVSLPLKRETFQLSSIKEPENNADAESYFTTKTVQQVVLDHGEPDCQMSDIPLLTGSGQLFKQSCVYIVTGGLSGLGFETVKFIAYNGGGCIATLSRSNLTDDFQFEMELLQRRYGVTIMNVKCDVSVSMQVVDAISKIEQRFSSCPIKGVFHSAAVLHDALIENLDESLLRKVLQPKVSGALNLHCATLSNKLDFFVCYSSISSFIGNASQCNYAAANSFLDTFCHYRRNLGLAGQSINWGPLNLGLLLNKDHFQKFLEAKGMMTMDVCDIQEALEKCLLMNRPQQVICKFNFKNLHIHVLSQNASLRERLSALVEMELKVELSNEPVVQHSSSAYESVRTIVSDISSVSVDELDDDLSLCALGIDSMLAMTLQNKIFQETGVNVPLVKILDPNSTLATLAALVKNNG